MIVVTRRDLSPGYQLVQTAHAVADFSIRFPDITKNWNSISNYMACLSAKDEQDLRALADKLDSRGIPYHAFREPDIDDQVTAIAIAPGEQSRKLTSNYPLALKEFNMNTSL